MPINTHRLLQAVLSRIRMIAIARSTYWITFGVAAVFALGLIASRIGLLPDFWSWWLVLLVPVAAALGGLMFHQRQSLDDAARLTDARMNTKDLFLTTAMLESAPGEYKPLVQQAAEEKAPTVKAATVVPFNPWPRMQHTGGVLVLLLVATMFLPPFDPFGAEADRQKEAERRQKLNETKKYVDKRTEVLKKEDLTAKRSPEIDQALKKLESTFRRMDRKDPKGNVQRLNSQKSKVAALHKRKTEEMKRLESSLDRQSMATRFGANAKKTQEMKRDLRSGNVDSVKQEIKDIEKKLEQIAKSDSSEEKAKLKQQIKDKLEALKEAAKQEGSKGLAGAIDKAMEQMKLSDTEGLDSEALESMAKSMDLSKMEADKLKQDLQDLKELEKALEAIQNAQQANKEQPLDGQQCEDCETFKDYAELYKAMAQRGASPQGEEGAGEAEGSGDGGTKFAEGDSSKEGAGGMGGPGKGRGGEAKENDLNDEQFQTEKVKTHLQAGKILMQMKTKELSETGEMERQYAEAMRDVKQSVSEAIVAEQVPPGYHGAVKGYFDNFDVSDTAPVSDGSDDTAGGVSDGVLGNAELGNTERVE